MGITAKDRKASGAGGGAITAGTVEEGGEGSSGDDEGSSGDDEGSPGQEDKGWVEREGPAKVDACLAVWVLTAPNVDTSGRRVGVKGCVGSPMRG